MDLEEYLQANLDITPKYTIRFSCKSSRYPMTGLNVRKLTMMWMIEINIIHRDGQREVNWKDLDKTAYPLERFG